MRVAAFDLGTNSFHLLVADADGHLGFSPIETKKEMVRLGEQVLISGEIPRPVLDRAIRTLSDLREAAIRHQPDATRAVATSAVREARNREEFIRRAQEDAGIEVTVLPGREEARLCYIGALSDAPPRPEPVALFDLGGGSLEIAIGEAHRILHTSSVRVGALRLARDLPPGGAPCIHLLPEMRARVEARLRASVAAALAAAGGGKGAPATLASAVERVAFSGGTARALARVAAFEQGPEAHARLTLDAVRDLVHRLAAMSTAQRRAVPGIEPGRIDSIVPGALVIETVLDLCSAGAAAICQRGLREGLVLDHVRRSERADQHARVAVALNAEPAVAAAPARATATPELRPTGTTSTVS